MGWRRRWAPAERPVPTNVQALETVRTTVTYSPIGPLGWNPPFATRSSFSQIKRVARRIRGLLESLPISALATCSTVGLTLSFLDASSILTPWHMSRAQPLIAAPLDRFTKPPVVDLCITCLAVLLPFAADPDDEPQPDTNNASTPRDTATAALAKHNLGVIRPRPLYRPGSYAMAE